MSEDLDGLTFGLTLSAIPSGGVEKLIAKHASAKPNLFLVK